MTYSLAKLEEFLTVGSAALPDTDHGLIGGAGADALTGTYTYLRR